MVKRNTAQRDKDRRLIAKAGAPCHICGQPIDYSLPYRQHDGTVNPGAFVVDHVVPLANGGADNLSNKAASHSACNSMKSDKPHANILRRSGVLG